MLYRVSNLDVEIDGSKKNANRCPKIALKLSGFNDEMLITNS